MPYNAHKGEKFEEVYRTYRNDVYRTSLYYIKDPDVAQDITQNVFYYFYCHFDNVNPDSIRAYLLRSCRNLSYNWLRDNKRQVGGDYIDNMPEENIPQYSVEDQYIRQEQDVSNREFIGRIMEELREENPSWYHILNLIYCLEKSHEDVCDELNMTRDVLYSKLYRAKRWIRKKFENEYREL